MARFEELLEPITRVAHKIAKNWGGRFEPNELVNEAWLTCGDFYHPDPPIVVNRAKFDMLSYIKSQTRDISIKKVRRKRPKLLTNVDVSGGVDDGHEDSYLERKNPWEDPGLLRLENNELLWKLLLQEPTKRQLKAIFHYYFEERSLKETGEILGIKECTTCTTIKRGIQKCQESSLLVWWEYENMTELVGK